MQIRVNFARGGPFGRGDTSKWRHGIPRSSISCGCPRAFSYFSVCSCAVVPTASFRPKLSLPHISNPSLILSLCRETLLLRRSLPYLRFLNSHAWARALPSFSASLNARGISVSPSASLLTLFPSDLLLPLSFSLSPSRSLVCACVARAPKSTRL